MAAKLQNPYPPTFPISSASGPAAAHRNPSQPAISPPANRRAAHFSQNSGSSQNTNPFRNPKHTPQSPDASNYQVFSPISPIVEDQENVYPQRPTRSVQTSSQFGRMSQEPRKSVDLRKLDGKPYPGREEDADAKPRKVKVAQDMYAGDMPPGYDPQDYSGPLASKEGHKGSCNKCGGHKKGSSESSSPTTSSSEKPQQPQNIDCRQCGGKKSMPPSSFPRAAMGNARAPPQAATRSAPTSSSEAGPSSAPSGHNHSHKHSCNKCGRRKRPDSISTTGSSSATQSPRDQPGLSFQNMPQLQTNGMPMVGINIEPPTAITERAPTLPFSPASTRGETPLIHQPIPHKKERKSSRSNSISSLFRSFSRRRRRESNDNSPLPSQQLLSKGEQNPDNIVDRISSAIRKGDDDNNNNYSRLRPDDHPKRPGSPFSFIDKPQEEQAFEMGDMRKSKQPERRNSWDKADESTEFLATGDRPRYSRSQSTRHGVRPGLQPHAQDDVYLALPPDQRPGITRFKSLRNGAARVGNGLSRSASQISRSTSLRRLESVKKVPQFWYRDDMAIEGASSEYHNYGY